MKRQKYFGQLTKSLIQSVIFWAFAFFFYALFRYYGLEHEFEGTAAVMPANIKLQTTFLPFLVLPCIGLVLGLLYGFIDFLNDQYFLKKMSLGKGLFLNTFFHFASTIIVFTIMLSLFSKILPIQIDLKPGWWLKDKRFWAIIWYIVICSFVFSFITIALDRFGRGVFLKMLLGHYKQPQEEERVFMFLDLKDSTAIAEKLGYQKYSRFIQDCFFDINEVILNNRAEIYQYVGDEVVLSWPYQKGVADNNCINLFFEFETYRARRKAYYLKEYGVFPEFKAGLHGGVLMAAEVGFIKKELAYHGDVINTSARIQEKCNQFGVTLLISEKLLGDLKIDSKTATDFIGDLSLKGKNKQVRIHTVKKLK